MILNRFVDSMIRYLPTEETIGHHLLYREGDKNWKYKGRIASIDREGVYLEKDRGHFTNIKSSGDVEFQIMSEEALSQLS